MFADRLTVTDLEPGQRYTFKVEAMNEAGFKSASNVESDPVDTPKAMGKFLPSFSVSLPLLDKPKFKLTPPRITVTGVDNVTLAWDAPEDEPSAEYTVQYKSDGSSIWNEVDMQEIMQPFSFLGTHSQHKLHYQKST